MIELASLAEDRLERLKQLRTDRPLILERHYREVGQLYAQETALDAELRAIRAEAERRETNAD